MKQKVIIPTILVSLVFLSLFSPLYAQNDKTEKIHKMFTHCYDRGVFNGTVLIAENGKIVYQNALGYSNFETGKKLKLNSAFYLASISKTFTSMAVMMLKERNKLTYDDKLSDYFSNFPPYAEQITIRNLLSHTSGLPEWTRFSIFRARPGDYIDDITNRDVYQFLIQQDTLDFHPGKKYGYSNSNYIVLAMIVEKVSGVPFHLFMKKNVFDPLNMTNTLVFDESKPKFHNRVTGYTMFKEKDDFNILTYGPGGIYSTVEDLYKWDQALYTEKLVSRETLHEAFTPAMLNDSTLVSTGDGSSYGLGWGLVKFGEFDIVRHGGSLNGFQNYFLRELNNRLVIIVLTNTGQNVGPIVDGVASFFSDIPFVLPLAPIAVTLHKIVANEGIGEAVRKYHSLRESHPKEYDFSERQLNNLGYYYLNKGKLQEAKSIFKLNIEVYSNASNVYDSYAEACMNSGEMDLAIRNYKKSLELNPDNTNAVEMLKRINEKK